MPYLPIARLLIARIVVAAAVVVGFAERLPAQNEERFAFVTDTSYREAGILAEMEASAKTLPAYAAKLEAAGTLMLRSRDARTRARAADTLQAGFAAALAIDGGREYPFAEVTSVSQLSDSTAGWRLFSWQHFVDDSTYVYGGYLVPAEESIAPVFLEDRAQHVGEEAEGELTADRWYGAVYYGSQAFRLPDGRPAWVLFGYDADGYYHRRKVADVLSFDPRGQPRFGAEVFVGSEASPELVRSRLILEYRTDARVGLRYDPDLGGIVHDRLVTGPPVRRGMPPSYVPDGSYDGFVLDPAAGLWRYREEYFDRVISAEPPRPQPILGGADARDLFGRPRRRGGR